MLTPAPDGYPIKLVRDNTAEMINFTRRPGDLWYGPCPEKDIDSWLRKKLVEEVAEYLVDPGEYELVDVLAVVDALAKRHGGSLERLIHNMCTDQRGLFRNAMMMYGRHDEFDVGPVPR